MGETLPFMMERLDVMPVAMTRLNRTISSYLTENVHYTFSGFNFMPAFLNLMLQVGIDRIMFPTDFPYSSMTKARAFLDGLYGAAPCRSQARITGNQRHDRSPTRGKCASLRLSP